MRPRKNVGVSIFSTPTIQLGDIVNIIYKNELQQDVVAPETSNFVVYNIEYSRDIGGPNMTLYLSEV
jgi:hypothetical protein